MEDKQEEFEIPEQLAEAEVVGAVRARNFQRKISESALEASQNIPQLPVAPNGIFRHPSTWTEEEDAIIARGIKAHLPLQVIGTKVNCERGTLSRHIKSSPDLLALFEDSKEDLVDRGEYEADRLMRSGNPAMVMFVLERMGRKRGWGQQEYVEPKGEEDIIQFTAIPESELERAETIRREKGAVEDDQISIGEIPKDEVFNADHIKNELDLEDAAEQLRKEREQPTVQNVEATSVSPPPYEQHSSDGTDEMDFDDGFDQRTRQKAEEPDDFPGGEFSPFGSF